MNKTMLPGLSHEVCECGYCRCEHAMGFGGRSNCLRYTWCPEAEAFRLGSEHAATNKGLALERRKAMKAARA